jgi:autotransporter-associated beta strand protein
MDWSNLSSDQPWQPGDVASFGNANGAAGVVTLGSSISASGVVFSQAGSGNYNISGTSDLITSAITVGANLSPIISAPLSSASLVVNGPGSITLTGNSNGALGGINVASGTVVIGGSSVLSGGQLTNAGTVQINSSASLTGAVLNTATFNVASGQSFTETNSTFNQSAGALNISGTLSVNQFADLGGTINGTVTTGSALLGPLAAGSIFGGSLSVSNTAGATSIPSGVTLGASTTLNLSPTSSYGTINVNSSSGSIELAVPAGFVNYGTINMSLTAVGGPNMAIGGLLTNAGTFNAVGSILLAFSGFTNSGTVNNGTYIAVGGPGFNQAAGVTTVEAGDALEFFGSPLLIHGGSINLASGTSPGQIYAPSAVIWPNQNAGAPTMASISTALNNGTPGELNLGGASAMPFNISYGSAVLTVSAMVLNGGMIKQGPGTMLLSGQLLFSGTTEVAGGTLNVSSGAASSTSAVRVDAGGIYIQTGSAASAVVSDQGTAIFGGVVSGGISVQSLNVSSGQTAVVLAPPTPAARCVLSMQTFTLSGTTSAWTSSLDVTRNDLDIAGGSLATITNQIASGYNSGNWNGSGGIFSSTAAADRSHLTALGVVQNNQSGGQLFSAMNPFDTVTPGVADILVKFTYYGDANLDGKVDGSDYSLIDGAYAAEHFAGGLPTHAISGWFNGDFNYDGVVNGSDYTLIDNAFNSQGILPAATISAEIADATPNLSATNSSVPEPVGGLMAAMAGGILCCRQRNRRRDR